MSDMISSIYPEWDPYLRTMSRFLIGTENYGPFALIHSVMAGRCAGVGREPRDCPGNEHYFQDKGFHPDFRDRHNQPYHFWGYVAQTAAPGRVCGGVIGRGIGALGNIFHEDFQSGISQLPLIILYTQAPYADLYEVTPVSALGWGTSWQDHTLSYAGMNVGVAITIEAITPAEMGDLMRSYLGPEGPGSRGLLQELEELYGPLAGSPP